MTTVNPHLPLAEPADSDGLASLNANQLATLLRVSQLLNSSLDLPETIAQSIQLAAGAVGAEVSSVIVAEPGSGELTFYVASGGRKESLVGLRMRHGEGIAGWVIDNDQTVSVGDAARDPRFCSRVDATSGFVTRSILCVPMKLRGQTFGALEACNRIDSSLFSANDEAFLSALAHPIASAIENAQLYTRLSEAHGKLQELDRMKTSFIAVASHELRTPLVTLKGYTDIMMMQQPSPEQAGFLKTMRRQVDRLTRLSHDLVNMSQIDGQRVSLTLSRFPLGELVSELAEEFSGFLTLRKQTLEHRVDPTLELDADRERLGTILSNLLLNAIRFTPDGGQLRIGARTLAPGFVEVSVTDTGIGIPAAEFDKIFLKCYESGDYRHHTSGTMEFRSGGLGLGLAIARGLVEAPGGKIGVESGLGKGSTFTFTVPAAAPRDLPAREVKP